MGAPEPSRTAAESWRDIPSPRASLVGVTTMVLAGDGGDVGSSEPHAATIAPTATLDRREHSTARGLLIRPPASAQSSVSSCGLASRWPVVSLPEPSAALPRHLIERS